MAEGFDPLFILAGLRSHGVSYVLVGGLAAICRGSPGETDDVDVVLPSDQENLTRLGLALEHLGAQPGPNTAVGEHRASFRTTAGRLDCLEVGEGYAELYAAAEDLHLDHGVIARVASVPDLIRLKRESGDLSGVAHLAALEATPPTPEAAAAGDMSEHGPAPEKRLDGVWKALERVDTFLTDLTNGDLHRQRRRS